HSLHVAHRHALEGGTILFVLMNRGPEASKEKRMSADDLVDRRQRIVVKSQPHADTESAHQSVSIFSVHWAEIDSLRFEKRVRLFLQRTLLDAGRIYAAEDVDEFIRRREAALDRLQRVPKHEKIGAPVTGVRNMRIE